MLDNDGLVVRHANTAGRIVVYDFSLLPVGAAMQRSLAAVFAGSCTPRTWASHSTGRTAWRYVRRFADFLSTMQRPPADLDEVTVAVWNEWVMSRPATGAGRLDVVSVARLLRQDARLQSGAAGEALARRSRKPASSVASYAPAEFDQVRLAARRTFRAARLRIADNARHLQRWHNGEFREGGDDWLLGEALECLARTGDVPRYAPKGIAAAGVVHRYVRVLGGQGGDRTWQRLFLSLHEATALGVLLLAEFGWNLAVISSLAVPQASPDPGEDGARTYRIELEKRRRPAGRQFETRNVTDDGAGSKGRLITEALEATRFARAAVQELAPGNKLLIVWRTSVAVRGLADLDREPPLGPFRFGIETRAAMAWARREGLDGSPFQRGRRTVNALYRREPGQNSQATHDSTYVLTDPQVRHDALPVIAAGAEEAAERARRAVLVAEVRDQADPGDLETATADCHDYTNSPYPGASGSCAASFLMCLGCTNARVHPGHHARLAHLHHALDNLRTALDPAVWHGAWSDTFARLDDLKSKVGSGPWAQALERVMDADRAIVGHLLTGELDT
ncbi:hypothetical protein F7Q99_29795 [Streptomyces kaniharaensis]|uniref:Uncharacterized protein n=1 Tax=Streptomyces kaniharaensis TaxID=212423 RepID=A0A6N7L0U4_9ACTN|nr:hypothetical protein [Streptomyces kaniharaensis]MQS16297.1 hypothetical protein [Streptomyces kaniharaensis]